MQQIQDSLIRRLKIHNYAIIDDVELEFSPHLVIITGETGAGKSILIEALHLVLGQRADTKAIGSQPDKCIVEAEFTIKGEELKPFFEANDLDFDTEIIVRREISTIGKSRAFINDTPVNLDILQTLSAALIDIHQQFDTLDIYQVSTQLKMIDALAGNKVLLTDYQAGYKKYNLSLHRLEGLKGLLHKQQQEEEFLKFQFNELNEINLVAGELESLEKEQKELAHAGEIKKTTDAITQTLTEDENSLVSLLVEMDRTLQPLTGIHKGLKTISERITSILAEIEDVSAESKKISDYIEMDPSRLAWIDERLSMIYRALQKHRLKSEVELLALMESLSSKLGSTQELNQEILALEQVVRQAEKELETKAKELHQRRAEVIPDFIEKIKVLLHPLGMENTRIRIDLLPQTQFNLTGKDQIEFQLATNKGGAFLPIKSIASGGELARFNLVTKSLVAQAIPLPTLIFDEIDIGISGEVALRMGKILKDLSAHHQVICITHSPQIAAKGDMHYFVYKDDQSDRTIARVKKLNKNDRIQSIAAMLSSNPPSAAAIRNAKELIEIV
ncbi:MAG: DNA repair protein RecN [Saprospiraceae bacterium]|nr:DNA repair protein RecN [Saprospiraceae bacterium]